MYRLDIDMWWTSLLLGIVICCRATYGQPGVPPVGSDFNDVRPDGRYQFGYKTGDKGQHYHAAVANQQNQVAGRFGSFDAEKKTVVNTEYTAGRRGFRARGPNIARKMDLSQVRLPYNPPVSPSSPNYNPTYDGYHDPNEDPTYSFGYDARAHGKSEASDSKGNIRGRYHYLDDIGERHDVVYQAGARTGFNVKTAFPDSTAFSGLFYRGPNGKPGGNPRGKTSILQNVDGSYRFISAGPDQRRAEQKYASGFVKGSYTYVDDKGKRRTVDYIAGPGIGYRIVKKGTGITFPGLPSIYPGPSPDIPELPSSSSVFPPIAPGGDDPFDNDDFPKVPGALRPGGRPGGSFKPNKPDSLGGSGSGGAGGGSNDFDDDFSPPWSTTESPVGSSTGTGSDGSGWTTSTSSPVNWDTGSTKPPLRPGQFDPTFGEDLIGYPPANPGFPPLYGTPEPPGGFSSSPSTTSFPSSKPTIPTFAPSTSTSGYPGYPEGYPSGRPKPGSQPFPFPNNCCKPGPPSAFPEDDPNKPSNRPPKPGIPDNFLQLPFEDLPPKDFSGPGYFRPRPVTVGSTSGLQVGDNAFLSSNKNYFSFPAGVAVRAHIQSLDILPFGSRIPEPGAALDSGVTSGSTK